MHSSEDHHTRRRIVEAARHLFHRQGFHATGIAAILRAARVNSGSLYHFFESKEALLAGVLDRYVEMLLPVVMEPAFSRVRDPIERVFAVLAWYRRGLLEANFDQGCPIGNLALEVADRLPAARRKIAVNFDNWCRAIEGCLREAGGRLPADVDRAALARFVLTVMEGGMMMARARREIVPFDQAVEQLRDYFDRLRRQARTRGKASGPHRVPTHRRRKASRRKARGKQGELR